MQKEAKRNKDINSQKTSVCAKKKIPVNYLLHWYLKIWYGIACYRHCTNPVDFLHSFLKEYPEKEIQIYCKYN